MDRLTPGTAPARSTGTAVEPARLPRWRRGLVAAFVALSCVLAPLSVIAVFVRNQVLDTDRYVENVTPLASDRAIIAATATQLTNALMDNVDVARAWHVTRCRSRRSSSPSRSRPRCAP